MSKKTKAEKVKAKAKKKPRRRARQHIGKRPNPAMRTPPRKNTPGLFTDPIFMHHVGSAIFRMLELSLPPDQVEKMNQPLDAEFLDSLQTPGSELASTVNSESPEEEKDGKAEN